LEIELPGCEPGVSFVVDRVASELFVEDGNHFYMVETFTRNIHVGDSDSGCAAPRRVRKPSTASRKSG
jgi:hypothetical protein